MYLFMNAVQHSPTQLQYQLYVWNNFIFIFCFFTFKNTSTSTSVVLGMLHCCFAPEMFCGSQHFSQLLDQHKGEQLITTCSV